MPASPLRREGYGSPGDQDPLRTAAALDTAADILQVVNERSKPIFRIGKARSRVDEAKSRINVAAFRDLLIRSRDSENKPRDLLLRLRIGEVPGRDRVAESRDLLMPSRDFVARTLPAAFS